MLMLYRECDNCGRDEERTFTDSWTGTELCIECLATIINDIKLSPQSDGDNIKKLLKEAA